MTATQPTDPATTAPEPKMKVNAFAKWYGGNVARAMVPGRMAAALGCRVNEVTFMGGGSELFYFTGRQRVANDAHRHIVNACRVIADPDGKAELAAMLDAQLFHPDALARSQRACVQIESLLSGKDPEVMARAEVPDVEWAFHYLVTTWMGRGGNAGKRNEFRSGMSVRHDADGGGSNQRYRAFVESLDALHAEAKRWEFMCRDFRDFLDCCHDDPDTFIFSDAPWVGKGKDYKHPFTPQDHADLAARHAAFGKARVLVRYGDCEEVRALYPAPHWRITEVRSRNQRNNVVEELLISNFDQPNHDQLLDESTAPEGSDHGAQGDQEG